MGELKDRIGGGWKPSPGAIYPALLALVEQGFVETVQQSDMTIYTVTPEGRQHARVLATDERWASLTARAKRGEERITVGSLLDEYAANSGLRRRLTGDRQRAEIKSILEHTTAEIEQRLTKGESNG